MDLKCPPKPTQVLYLNMQSREDGTPLTEEESNDLMYSSGADYYDRTDITAVVADWRTFTVHMPKQRAGHFLQNRINHLRHAFQIFDSLGTEKKTKDERAISLYEALVNDFKENEEEWCEFWQNISNVVWCERSVEVVNTYATVLRVKAEELMYAKDSTESAMLTKCEACLNMGGRLLIRYREMVDDPACLGQAFFGDISQLEESRERYKHLTYKYYLIKHTLLFQTNRGKRISPSEIRFQSDFELNHSEFENQTVSQFCHALGKPCNAHTLSIVTDQEIQTVYKDFHGINKFMAWNSALGHQCGACGLFEEKDYEQRGGYKMCSRCRNEYYCSLKCQKAHWKQHKQVCVGEGGSALLKQQHV